MLFNFNDDTVGFIISLKKISDGRFVFDTILLISTKLGGVLAGIRIGVYRRFIKSPVALRMMKKRNMSVPIFL